MSINKVVGCEEFEIELVGKGNMFFWRLCNNPFHAKRVTLKRQCFKKEKKRLREFSKQQKKKLQKKIQFIPVSN